MNVTICDTGCGRTSKDPEANIEAITVAIRINGNDETQRMTCSMCRFCRDKTERTVAALMTPASLDVQVRPV